MLHATLFCFLVLFSMFKILDYYEIEWGTLFQWWWWNLFAYLYVALVHFIVVNKKIFTRINLKIKLFSVISKYQ